MSTFIVISWRSSAVEAEICTARWLTAEEKMRYAEWYRDIGMIGLGSHTELPGLTIFDMPDRQSDGSFRSGSSGWIITDEEAQQYIALSAERVRQAKIKELQERIAAYRRTVKAGDRQADLPSDAEARRREREYNDINNDGGYGFVPHVVSRSEYDHAVAQIAELQITLDEMI